MTSAFIRVLFGDALMPGMGKRPEPHAKVVTDIQEAVKRPHQIPAISYVYGLDNALFLEALGLPVRLLDERSMVYDPQPRGNRFRHKLAAWTAALESYDEIVALDWDVYLAWGPIPDDFWQRMRSRSSPILCNLFQYIRPKAYWRGKEDKRKSPSGAFMYLRNPDGLRIVREVATCWDRIGYNHTEEEAIAYWMDHHDGGWHGVTAWGEKYEPGCCLYPYRAMDGHTEQDPKNMVFCYEGLM